MVRSQQPKYRQKENLNVFGTFVQQVCEKLGTSWQQVARKAEIDPSTIHYWCTGKEPSPKLETLTKFYEALRQYPNWLDTYKQHLFILAGHSTDELKEESKRFTEYLERTNKVKYPDKKPPAHP